MLAIRHCFVRILSLTLGLALDTLWHVLVVVRHRIAWAHHHAFVVITDLISRHPCA